MVASMGPLPAGEGLASELHSASRAAANLADWSPSMLPMEVPSILPGGSCKARTEICMARRLKAAFIMALGPATRATEPFFGLFFQLFLPRHGAERRSCSPGP